MPQGAPLFVVCKNCGSEVSPYVTECPYCGQRVRKRAPKIEREGPPGGRQRRRQTRTAPRAPRLSRLRGDEIPGLRGDFTARPYATIGLVGASFVVYLILAAGGLQNTLLFVAPGGVDQPVWHFFTAPFVHSGGGATIFAGGAYQFATMIAIGAYGWLLERRHGPLVPLLMYVLAGAGGMAAAAVIDPNAAAGGSNGLGLGLLTAWAMPDVLSWRRGEDWEGDLMGTGVIALVLLAMPAAVDLANVWAGLAGIVAGLVVGLPLALVSRR